MEKIKQDAKAEIVFGSVEPKTSIKISRQVKAKALRRIAPKLYTNNFKDTPRDIIRRHLYVILGHYFPHAVISHRSALEGGMPYQDVIFLTYKYQRKFVLPGITVQLLQGKGHVEGDMPFMEKLFIASRTRALLENLQSARERSGPAKTWSREQIEDYLDELIRVHGEGEINHLRDQAKKLAKKLDLAKEYKILNNVISAILGTHEKKELTSQRARARAAGVPYDAHRLELFTALYSELKRRIFPKRPELKYHKLESSNQKGFLNLAFFDAYFSNYIEGTRFEVEEAAEIIFLNKPILQRPEDSHDILGTYRLLSNKAEITRIPDSAYEFVDLLKSRHAILLYSRSEKKPGQLKEVINRAGATIFVTPDLVRGTLYKGFELYQALEHPLARAMFMMFLVTEVHPFADGNGRIARVMMNAELAHKKQCRIIIPTVYREDYLLALKALSRNRESDPYIKMLERAQDYVSRINFSDYKTVLSQLRKTNAFLEPHEGRLIMPEK